MNELTRLLSLKQAAEALGFHPETLRRNIKRYGYPHYKIGGELRFKLEELLDATQVSHNSDWRDCVDHRSSLSINNATQSIGGVPDGSVIRRSTRSETRALAEEFEAKLKYELYRQAQFGERAEMSWREAVVKFISESETKSPKDNISLF